MGQGPHRRLLAALFLLLSFLAVVPPPMEGTSLYHIMEKNEVCGVSPCSTPTFGSTTMLAQSFKASDGYNFTRVSLHLSLASGVGPATVTLATDAGGTPVLPLASTSASTTSLSSIWVEFTFPSPVPLVKGSTYWIVANTSGTVAYRWTLAGSDTYIDGRSASGNFMGGWVDSSRDHWFRTFGFVDARIAVAMAADTTRPQPGDGVTLRVYFNNTGTETAPRVWINVSLPPLLVYGSYANRTIAGLKTGNHNWTFQNVPKGTQYFDLMVRVREDVPRGTPGTVVAHLDYRNSAMVPQPPSTAQLTLIVGLRTKTLYLHETGNLDALTTKRPSKAFNCNAAPAGSGDGCDWDRDGDRGVTIVRGGFNPGDARTFHDWTLTPPMARDFTIFSGISLALWMDDKSLSGEQDSIQADLYRNSTAEPLASLTLDFRPDRTLGFQPFYLNATGFILDLPRSSTLLMRLTVPGTSAQNVQVSYNSTWPNIAQAFLSSLTLETPDYITVEEVTTRDQLGPTSTFVPGEAITVSVRVVDPLGADDILDSDTRMELYFGSSPTPYLSQTMTLDSTDPTNPSAWKFFTVTFSLGEESPQGAYTVRVSATEKNPPLFGGDFVSAANQTTLSLSSPRIQPGKTVAEATATQGTVLHYTIHFNNTGTAPAPKVWVNDTMPAQVSYLNDSAGGNASARWVYTNLVPGGHRLTLNVTLVNGTPGSSGVVNQVEVTYLDNKGYIRTPRPATALTVVSGPVILIMKVADSGFVEPGRKITYNVTVANAGNEVAPRVWVNDTLSPNVTYDSDTASLVTPFFQSIWVGGSMIHINFTNVSPGSFSFDLVVFPVANLPGGTRIDNLVAARWTDVGNRTFGPTQASATTFMVGPKVAIFLNMSYSSRDPGALVALELRYDNVGVGVAAAYSVTMDLALGPHLDLTGASAGGFYNATSHTLTWSFAVVYPGETGTLRANATLRPGTPDRTQVQVSALAIFYDERGNLMPPRTAARNFSVTAPVLGLRLVPEALAVATGALFNYTLLFNNTGTGTAGEVWINSSLSAYTPILTVTVSTLGEIRVLVPRLGNRVYMHFQVLKPGAYVATLQVEVRAGLRDNVTVPNGVTLAYTDGGGNPWPSLAVTANITAWSPQLLISLQSNATEVYPDGTVNLTYSVTNLGHAIALNVWLNASLDPDLTLVDWGGQSTWTGAQGSTSWHTASLSPQESRTLFMRLRVSPRAAADRLISNVATATYTDAFGLDRTSMASNTATVRVLPRPAGPFPLYYLLPALGLIPVVVYHRRRLPRVHEVFVVYKDGSLLAHRSRTRTSEKDEDVLMAMFTAIQDFIKESFSYGSTRELKRMDLDEYSVEIARGDRIYVALIFEGRPTPALTPTLQSLVARIEADHKEVLGEWAGDMSQVASIADDVASLFPRHVRSHLAKGALGSHPR